MANYTASDWAKGQALLTQQFQAAEIRIRKPVAFEALRRSTEIMVPSHNILRTREDRPFEANYFNRTARALGTGGRTFNHTGTRGDSSILTPSFTTYDDVFVNTIKGADNSIYTPEQVLANEFRIVLDNFSEGLESASADFIFNNKSAINVATADGTFNAVDDVFEITESSEGDRAIQITKSMMHENKYSSNLICFCDTVSFNKFNFQANQGQANNQNLSFQFNNIEFVHSVEMNAHAASLSHALGFWVVAPVGMVAALDWIPRQNREGVDTKVNRYSTLQDPNTGLTLAMHDYQTRLNGTSLNGFTQDVSDQVEVSVDISFNDAPLTNATETVIQAVALI